MFRWACYVVRGIALGIGQCGATHIAALWHCIWGRVPRGTNTTCLALSQLLVTFPTTHKHIGPFWCSFLGGRVCVRSRTLWVSPMNYPEVGSLSCCYNPHRIFQPEVLRLYFRALEPWVAQPVSLPSCSSWFLHMQMWDRLLCQPLPCLLHPLAAALPGLHLASCPSVCLAVCLHPSYQSG